QERARAERAELARAWQALETDGPVRLSSFRALDPMVFDRLLDLLGRALAARRDADGRRRATTGDGRAEVVLSPPPDGRTAVLRTAQGTMTGPDYVIHITAVGGAISFPAVRSATGQEAAG
ncbi:DUF2397 family protein, partial [Streptomyces clavuligerus]|uniref:DUF2397 family protein n=1 Tax=Streptomyces clavuligerus TaxID=1901 RepID=UPI0018D006F8